MKLVKRSSLLPFFVIALFVFSSCQNEEMDEDKLVRIYVENLIIEETHRGNSETIRMQKESLFKKFNTTKDKFETELTKIGTDKYKWESFFNKSRELLEDLRKSGAVN
ncbi:MAG: hypothetical protein AB1394_01380 [Bacteroidota bacterium]